MGVLVVLASGVGTVLPSVATADLVTFEYTGAPQEWVVPYGVTSATFDLMGAEGRGFNCEVGCRFLAGRGGRSAANIAVTPRSTVQVMVGGVGQPNAGGFNGGGNALNGGGGATDIRIGGTSLSDRVLVAGGGGGTGGCADSTTSPVGGAGGGATGWNGQGTCGANGGGGASQTGGGTTPNGYSGSLGQGGGAPGAIGGGGGGGYYGGGSGSQSEHGGAGGGGSGYGPPGYQSETGVWMGNGIARITYQVTEKQKLLASAVGAGEGSLTSSPAGIDCRQISGSPEGTCSAEFGQNEPVTLTANPAPGSIFKGWLVACKGSQSLTCTTTMSTQRIVSAEFVKGPRTLSVTRTGDGSGSVTSSPSGIECGSTCSADFPYESSVTLTASPGAYSSFTGWSGGGCSGTAPCTVTMDQARNVEAQFTVHKLTLKYYKFNTGPGTMTSSPAGILCGPSCQFEEALFPEGSSVTLTPSAATGSEFVRWGNDCQTVPANQSCTVTMSQARVVVGEFVLQKEALAVIKSGNGAGDVVANPAGIDCGSVCTANYDYGTGVTLTATPAPGSLFSGWSGGDCSGAATTCTVTMDQARNVEATFVLEKRTLSASAAGNGSGQVSSTPAGIDCGPTCSAEFDYGAQIELSATPAAGSEFTGWSGDCSGTSTCVVTMDQARSVAATFALRQYPLSVSHSGDGAGTVTSPSGISCGGSCEGSYGFGTTVALTAEPATGSEFTGWSGDCSGTSTCVVAMDQARSVKASFALRQGAPSSATPGGGAGPTDATGTPKADPGPSITRLTATPLSPRSLGRIRVEVTLSEEAAVTFRIKGLGRRSKALSFRRSLKAGLSTLAMPSKRARGLAPGRYELTVTATGTGGQGSATRRVVFRIPRPPH